MEDCHTSWEVEQAIPTEVLQEFKSNTEIRVDEKLTEGVGQTSHILSITTKDKVEPNQKRQKTERRVLDKDNG